MVDNPQPWLPDPDFPGARISPAALAKRRHRDSIDTKPTIRYTEPMRGLKYHAKAFAVGLGLLLLQAIGGTITVLALLGLGHLLMDNPEAVLFTGVVAIASMVSYGLGLDFLEQDDPEPDELDTDSPT